MLQLHYFASLREQLQLDQETLDWQTGYRTVADIKHALSQRSPGWQQALANPSLLVAVNQTMANAETTVLDGDEIAFFPPVSGG